MNEVLGQVNETQRTQAEQAWAQEAQRLSERSLRVTVFVALLYAPFGLMEWAAFDNAFLLERIGFRLAPFLTVAALYFGLRRIVQFPALWLVYFTFLLIFFFTGIELPAEEFKNANRLLQKDMLYLIADLVSFLVLATVVLIPSRHIAVIAALTVVMRAAAFVWGQGGFVSFFLEDFGIYYLIVGAVAYISQSGRFSAAKANFVANYFLKTLNEELEGKNSELEEKNKEIRKERDRSEELLLNILPKSTAEELKANGKAQTRSYEKVSILFADFKGFTKAAETMSAEQLVAELDDCFRTFDEIVERHGLEKIKTIGDAYMAAGGLPEPNGTHARDCVNAALEMQHFLYEWNAELQTKANIKGVERPEWQMRVGVHTGPVVAGVVGKRKFQYDIWGDAVNVGARAEQYGEVGRVNVTEATWAEIEQEFEGQPRGEVHVKNKREGIRMYFIESTKQHVQKPFFFD